MNTTSCVRTKRLTALLLAILLAAAVPFAGLSASAAGMVGAPVIAGTPPFAYLVTGLKVESGADTVKLYQDANMQSYATYTGEYEIPEQIYDADSLTMYTVNEIGGAIGDSIPGALERVPARKIGLPGTIVLIGARAFANSGVQELTFPTSVQRVQGDAFLGVSLQTLTLSVTEKATLTSSGTYQNGESGLAVVLPHAVTNLRVQEPLRVSSSMTIPGDVEMQGGNLLLDARADVTVSGTLSGAGLIEVSNAAVLTVHSVSGFSGRINLVGADSKLVNRSSAVLSVYNSEGKLIDVLPGESSTGETQVTEPEDDPSLYPQITQNEGGRVVVSERGKVIEIIPDIGYRIEEVVINGFSMGTISRYEFAQITPSNTVVVTFAQGQGEIGPDAPTYFVDVSSSSPYAEAIYFLVNNGICSGVGGGRFAPQERADRATLLFLLKQLERYDADFAVKCEKFEIPYDDVPQGKWYTEAVGWAVNTGIWNRAEKFYPGRFITREEFALALYRYTRARGYAAYQEAGRYHAYVDSTLLVYESRQAMTWAATVGYLKVNDRKLNPAGAITRGELAQALATYLRIN